jgi:hypothetical protein
LLIFISKKLVFMFNESVYVVIYKVPLYIVKICSILGFVMVIYIVSKLRVAP